MLIAAIPAVQRKGSDSPKYIMRQGKTPAVFDYGVLTKSNHRAAIMMEKIKNISSGSAEDEVLNIEKKDIEQYLSEVKEAVRNDRYRLDRNAKRQDNINLFLDYVIVISFHEQKHPLAYYFK